MTTRTIRVDHNSAFAIAFFLIHALFSQNSICAFQLSQVRSRDCRSSSSLAVEQSTSSSVNDDVQPDFFTVQVSYDGIQTDLEIMPNETILSALERSAVHDELSVSSLPNQCRRGNCLTCTGCHLPNSAKSNVKNTDDSLSPPMSENLSDSEYVLMCTSSITGDGVKLELGRHDEVWDDMYSDKFKSSIAETIHSEAVAKSMRLASEKNRHKWVERTEKLLSATSH